MKKRISALLAVVLTIALLASSFVMFGVNAEDPANDNAEKITIGENEYEVFKDKKYDVYSDFAALVNGKNLGDAVTFDDGWSMAVKYTNLGYEFAAWGGALSYKYCNPMDSDSVTKGIKVGNYMSNSWYLGSVSFAPTNDKVMVFPSMTNIDTTIPAERKYEPAIKLTYSIKEDANIVLYDSTGVITCNGMAVSPYWSSENDNAKITVKIYHNNTEIWPADSGDNNVIYKSAHTINFPDLGEIAVEAGDQISIVFEGPLDTNGSGNLYSPRAGVFCNPVVAVSTKIPTTKKVTIGENTYDILINENYDLYSDFSAVVEGLTPGDCSSNTDTDAFVTFDGKWSMSYQYVNDKGFGINPWNTKLNYEYCIPWHHTSGQTAPQYYGIQVSNYLSTNNYSNLRFTSAVTFVPNTNKFFVSPTTVNDFKAEIEAGKFKEGTVEPALKLSFTSDKLGYVVLYDKNGKFDGTGAETDPWWANEAPKNGVEQGSVTIKIFKNDMQLWPAEGETAKINYNNKTIDFPDLGKIAVNTGDQISIVVYGDPAKVSTCSGVFMSPAIGYTGEVPTTETMKVGDKYYDVIIEEKYNAYEGLTETVKDVKLGTATDTDDKTGLVDFDGNWSMAYQYTSDKGYGVKPWGEKFGIKYCKPYYYTGDKTKDPGLKGLQPAYYLSLNTYNNCFFTSSILFMEEDEKLFISPTTAGAFTAENIDKNVYAPALKLTYTSNIEGKAVLFDKTGKFSGSNLAIDPYWANEGDSATVKIEIYHNNKKIWPKSNTQTVSKNNLEILFPDLGELNLKIGDKINFVFYANPEAPAARAALTCNPGIAFTEVTKKVDISTVVKTDANFGTEVMVLVSVIVALGGVVVTMGAIAKKRAHN